MTLGMILLLWPLASWLMEKLGPKKQRAATASAGAAVVDRGR